MTIYSPFPLTDQGAVRDYNVMSQDEFDAFIYVERVKLIFRQFERNEHNRAPLNLQLLIESALNDNGSSPRIYALLYGSVMSLLTLLEDSNAPVPNGQRTPLRLVRIILGGRDGLNLLQDRLNQLSPRERRETMLPIYSNGTPEQKEYYDNSFELFYQLSLGMSYLLAVRNRNLVHRNNARYFMAVVSRGVDNTYVLSTSITTVHISWALKCVGERVLTYLDGNYQMILGAGPDDPNNNADPGLLFQEEDLFSVSMCLETVFKTRIALDAVRYRIGAGQERFLYETAAAVLCVVVVEELGLIEPTEDYYQALKAVRNGTFAHAGAGIRVQNNIVEYLNLDDKEWQHVEKLLEGALSEARIRYQDQLALINLV